MTLVFGDKGKVCEAHRNMRRPNFYVRQCEVAKINALDALFAGKDGKKRKNYISHASDDKPIINLKKN